MIEAYLSPTDIQAATLPLIVMFWYELRGIKNRVERLEDRLPPATLLKAPRGGSPLRA